MHVHVQLPVQLKLAAAPRSLQVMTGSQTL